MSSPLTSVDTEKNQNPCLWFIPSQYVGNITFDSPHSICIPTASEPVQMLNMALNKPAETSLVFAAMKTHLEIQATLTINMIKFFYCSLFSCIRAWKSPSRLSNILSLTQCTQGCLLSISCNLKRLHQKCFFFLSFKLLLQIQSKLKEC